MKTNLMAASNQWMVRPADERFWTLRELFTRTQEYAQESRVERVNLSQCAVLPSGDESDIVLTLPDGKDAQFQHYSFGQMANLCHAPASYLRELPADLAAANLNHGLSKLGPQALMLHQNGGLHLRCVTSESYARIWNWEIAELALALEEGDGWMTPPARPSNVAGLPVRKATQADVLRKSAHKSLGIKVGDDISPAGLYASDHDCFIFQVNEDFSVDAGGGEQLYRGVFWTNSEVGDAKFKGTMFLYDSICGNHIVWGAKVIQEITLRHVGRAREAFGEIMATVTANLHRVASEDESRIQAAKRYELGDTRDKVVERVFRRDIGLSRQNCEGAYRLAEMFEDQHHAAPTSAWGFVSGLTRLSQGAFGDARDKIDRAGGRILEMAL